jgi:hypothetical protein
MSMGHSSRCQSRQILITRVENHSLAALPHNPKKENGGVAQLAVGEWNTSHELLDIMGWRRTEADVCLERSGTRTPEEEVVDVLGRVEAEGAIVNLENAVTIVEASRIAMPENPEEHPHLRGRSCPN